jgi:hypothetical protein
VSATIKLEPSGLTDILFIPLYGGKVGVATMLGVAVAGNNVETFISVEIGVGVLVASKLDGLQDVNITDIINNTIVFLMTLTSLLFIFLKPSA